MSIYENLTEKEQFACRVIADHARATAFAIADGILPGNEGRNYVLRKIMRRAIYHGRQTLGFDDNFFNKVTDFVIGEMRDAYPELEQQRAFIEKMVSLEEKRFGNTMTVGLKKLNELLEKNDFIPEPHLSCPGIIKIADLAPLYDTFGTPIDLMYVVLTSTYPDFAACPDDEPYEGWTLEKDDGWVVDEELEQVREKKYVWFPVYKLPEDDFRKLIEEELAVIQKPGDSEQAKQASKDKPAYVALSRRHNTKSEFRGYETTQLEGAKVIALIKGDAETDALNEGDEGEVLLDVTPFYAESGGQVGDIGTLSHAQAHVVVKDTFTPVTERIIHKVKIERGTLRVGDVVTATVDAEKRDATRRNHTATHLLHAALREVLGTHVKQAGSVVAPNYLRFDFSHYQPLTKEETVELERLVNLHIIRNAPVNTNVMAIEEAMRAGAMALFGEKYGANVRVSSVGDGEFSRELCGGTHVRATGDIGTFKITSDESIASGTRRIRAVTGADAFALFQETWERENELAQRFRIAPANMPAFVDKLQEDLKKSRKEADELKLKLAMGAGGAASDDEARDVKGVKVLAREASALDVNGARQLSDTLLERLKSGVVIIGRASDGKVSLIVRSSDDVKGRVPAGKVISELAALVGGRGGGRPDMAEGGGTQPEKLGEALAASYGIVEKLLG